MSQVYGDKFPHTQNLKTASILRLNLLPYMRRKRWLLESYDLSNDYFGLPKLFYVGVLYPEISEPVHSKQLLLFKLKPMYACNKKMKLDFILFIFNF